LKRQPALLRTSPLAARTQWYSCGADVFTAHPAMSSGATQEGTAVSPAAACSMSGCSSALSTSCGRSNSLGCCGTPTGRRWRSTRSARAGGGSACARCAHASPPPVRAAGRSCTTPSLTSPRSRPTWSRSVRHGPALTARWRHGGRHARRPLVPIPPVREEDSRLAHGLAGGR